MLDLTHFIFNSNSFLESSVTTQELSDSEPSVEFNNDQDNSVDPSSFVLLFADILANNPEKNETKPNECISESNALNLNTQTQENKVIGTDDVKEEARRAEQDKPIINVDITTTHEDKQSTGFKFHSDEMPLLPDNSNAIKLNTELEQLPLGALENNVAIAWINSENFQPPSPISFISLTESMEALDTLAQDFSPEVEEFIEGSEELTELVLKKEMPLNHEPVSNEQAADSSRDKLFINSTDDSSNLLQAELRSNPFSIKPEIKQEQKIENLTLTNAQNIAQPEIDFANENQPLIDNAETKSLDIPIDISDSQWVEKFSENIVWLGHQGIKSALIKIHPEDLGPLEISIKVVKDSASVSIHSHNSHVCDIVDQALPRLREMMAEQGLNLSDVYVGSDDGSRQFSENNHGSEEVTAVNIEDEVQAAPLAKKTRDGLIDYFA
ncbi:flagellar hook-length control protein FliK [Legionella fallonii]|uniref:Putative Flagellar hook-length control protein n=1 Tax=Legionella fallonii LLAP-10 TaxID=1212491 RepID=A0A098G537_9GAMM|nr:flagellar hook-length control protein FliK [Legionella fallonii]CEG57104.1 putative Flagellar hook-length control protein [Legionella fallonii LLAP-10]